MKFAIRMFFVLGVLLFMGIHAVDAQALTGPMSTTSFSVNSTEGGPQKIDVGLYILNLGKFDIASGTYTADFYLSMDCEDECPPFEFEFMNGRASSFEKIIDEKNEKFYRIQANLNNQVDLRRFPFDTQALTIALEDKRLTSDELVFVPNVEESGIDPSVAFTGWNIDQWNATTIDHHYGVYDETYSQYVFSIPISRILISAVIKTFLPITFIILVMLSSFILDPDKISTRLAMVGSALVASVMFHVSLANQIPSVGYLTFADKFMILTYFVILLSFALNVTMLEMLENKKTEMVEKMHRATEYTMFIVVPLLYLLLFVFFL